MGEREPDHVAWSSDTERRLLGPLSAGTDDGNWARTHSVGRSPAPMQLAAARSTAAIETPGQQHVFIARSKQRPARSQRFRRTRPASSYRCRAAATAPPA